MSGARPSRAAMTLLRGALRCFPRRYRRAHGDELLAMVEHRYREQTDAKARRRVLARAIYDFAAAGLAERGSGRTHRPRALGGIGRDLRFGARALLSSPVFTAIAVVALALGIGASSAVFSVVDAVLIRPLPFPDADRLMTVWETNGDWLRNGVSAANFLDWRRQSTSFEQLSAAASVSVTMTGADEPLRLEGFRVTERYFDVLGVEAALGRTFTPDEDRRGDHRVVLLSALLWRQAFEAREDVIDSSVLLDGEPYTIVGVMPDGFNYPLSRTRFWVPMAFPAEEAERRSWRFLSVIGRLRVGVEPGAAQAEMEAIGAGLAEAYPVANEDVSVNLIPMRADLVGPVEPILLAVLGAIGFVLLIACANVANLMLTRATVRRGEVAIRAALGAGRAQIVQQLMIESLLVALAAGALGLAGGAWAVGFLTGLIPAWIPLPASAGLDLRMAGFALAVSVATALVFGIVPALSASRLDLSTPLRGARGSATAAQNRLRAGLVTAELALAVVLLVGAGLMARSFVTLLDEPLGFRQDGVLVAQVGLTAESYGDPEARSTFYERLLEDVRARPGVGQAAMITSAPLLMSGGALIYTPEGQPTADGDATFRVVTPGYFDAIGIGMLGRDFADADRQGGLAVAIVGRELARRAWADDDPIGKRFKLGREDGDSPWLTIVGVADDVRQWGVELPARPAIYLPYRQWTASFAPRDLIVSVSGDVAGPARAIRAAVASLDPDVPVSSVRTMSEIVATAVGGRRFNLELFAAFAVVAVVLACLGVYGVISFSVAQRTRELGIRVALGARPGDLTALVLRQGMLSIVAGLAIGLAGAIGLSRFLESMLYGVEPLDAATFAAVPAMLLLVAAVATWLPAHRARRVDPLVALKHE